jgi:glyceraldehyde 3-phosphate dehydrogenase
MKTMEAKTGYEAELQNWVSKERATVSLINSVGTLMYDKGVELVFFRNHLVDLGVNQVLSLFDYADNVVGKYIDAHTTAEVAKVMKTIDLAPSKIDIGKLTMQYLDQKESNPSIQDFLITTLSKFLGNDKHSFEPRDVVLYGFGRIGRLAARELVKQAGKGQQLRLRAIVTRNTSDEQIIKRAALLRNDSVHGTFNGTVQEDLPNKRLIVNGQIIEMIEAKNPEDIDYTEYDMKNVLVIDNTGVFNNKEALSRHLESKGATKVLLTAPGAGIPNIVYGINHKDLDLNKTNIYSAASCTTNAISPVLKVIEEKLKVEKGHIETIHAYTNDQNLLDNMHKKPRRGRSAAINMVITSTGAGKAVTKVIPSLEDKLTANAVRVPTPNGSLAIMNLTVGRETSLEEVNEMIKSAALNGELINQINYNINKELVSNDIIGNTCCAVYDSNATLVSPDNKSIVLYVWYDNEFGYTKQVIRLAKYVAEVRRLIYY